jgi:hypothetical protein
MSITQLQSILDQIRHAHGDLPVLCNGQRVACVVVHQSQATPHLPIVSIIPKEPHDKHANT